MAKENTTPPLSPVGSSTESTPVSPFSTESGFSVPSHRDSVSTTSTAFSSVEAVSESGDSQKPDQPQPCTSCGNPTSRPQLFKPAKTTTAVPTTGGSIKPLPSNKKPVKHDPLSRDFPKPDCGATIEEMLARNPAKWSLNHWIKKEAEVRQRTTVTDKEAEARRFAETKAALLKSHQEMMGGTLPLGGSRGSGAGAGAGSDPTINTPARTA
ncbi:hypothetical protein V8F20_004537 [Naviculisporaceae sp. PSN 640]